MTQPHNSKVTTGPFVSRRPGLSRRQLLRGAGVALALPFLDAMSPRLTKLAAAGPSDSPGATPRRMLGICNNLSLLNPEFFPTDAGRNYTLSPYLELLRDHRQDFTVFSGVSHPEVDGGHPADICFLTA